MIVAAMCEASSMSETAGNWFLMAKKKLNWALNNLWVKSKNTWKAKEKTTACCLWLTKLVNISARILTLCWTCKPLWKKSDEMRRQSLGHGNFSRGNWQHYQISGDDFSKIQGRFNTRLSLSSSSVDEVIKSEFLLNRNCRTTAPAAIWKESSGAEKPVYVQSCDTWFKGLRWRGRICRNLSVCSPISSLWCRMFLRKSEAWKLWKALGGERSMLSGLKQEAIGRIWYIQG